MLRVPRETPPDAQEPVKPLTPSSVRAVRLGLFAFQLIVPGTRCLAFSVFGIFLTGEPVNPLPPSQAFALKPAVFV